MKVLSIRRTNNIQTKDIIEQKALSKRVNNHQVSSISNPKAENKSGEVAKLLEAKTIIML